MPGSDTQCLGTVTTHTPHSHTRPRYALTVFTHHLDELGVIRFSRPGINDLLFRTSLFFRGHAFALSIHSYPDVRLDPRSRDLYPVTPLRMTPMSKNPRVPSPAMYVLFTAMTAVGEN